MSVPRSVVLFLTVGIIAASQSGNIIRLADAPPLAIAAWRLVLASVLLAPLAGRRLRALAALGWRDLGLLALAGAVLCAHFVAWIAAVQHTTVANAAVFFAINPVITATAAHFVFGERLGWRLAGAIALGVVGVAAIGVADLHFSSEQLLGDGLAVLCSVLFTVYFLLGKTLRRRLDNRVYVTALYGVAGLCSFAAMGALGLSAFAYEPKTWLAFLLMALLPTMLGHTSLNFALRYMDAGRISTLTLSEPLLAGLVAMWAWGESPSPWTLVGYALICASVLVTVRDRPRGAANPTPPPEGPSVPPDAPDAVANASAEVAGGRCVDKPSEPLQVG